MDIFGFVVAIHDRIEPHYFITEQDANTYLAKLSKSDKEYSSIAKLRYYEFKAFEKIQIYATPYKLSHTKIWNEINNLRNDDLKQELLINLALLDGDYFAQDYFDYIIYAVLRLENSDDITKMYTAEEFNELMNYEMFITNKIKDIEYFARTSLEYKYMYIFDMELIKKEYPKLVDKLNQTENRKEKEDIQKEIQFAEKVYKMKMKLYDAAEKEPLKVEEQENLIGLD